MNQITYTQAVLGRPGRKVLDMRPQIPASRSSAITPKGTPALFIAIAYRWWEPGASSPVAIGGTPTANATLQPTCDWIRSHE